MARCAGQGLVWKAVGTPMQILIALMKGNLASEGSDAFSSMASHIIGPHSGPYGEGDSKK